jgi:3'(2'), 5'-bisphosphate nucleotidase
MSPAGEPDSQRDCQEMTDNSVTEYGALARALIDLAHAAAREIMDVYAHPIEVETKEDASPVTHADRRAEEVIAEGLARLEPGVGVIAEEAFSRGDAVEVGEAFFLVDPLDGTREFISRNGEFTVNIALVVANTPTVGVIIAPALARTFAAWGPGRAFEKSRSGALRPISARAFAPGRYVAIASRSHRDQQTDAYLTALGASQTLTAGSSLKFCLLAAGDADIYPRFGPTCEWDIAAGHAILEAAGGHICGLDGADFAYGKRDRDFLNPGFIAWGDGPRPALPGEAGSRGPMPAM